MSLDLDVCPRCDSPLDSGFVNAGKGPLRWNEDAPDKTIIGGEILLDQGMVWGRQRTEAKRCLNCHLVMFEFAPEARRKPFTSTK